MKGARPCRGMNPCTEATNLQGRVGATKTLQLSHKRRASHCTTKTQQDQGNKDHQDRRTDQWQARLLCVSSLS